MEISTKRRLMKATKYALLFSALGFFIGLIAEFSLARQDGVHYYQIWGILVGYLVGWTMLWTLASD